MLRDLPQYECLLSAAIRYPSLDPGAADVFLNLLRTGDLVAEAESAFLMRRGVSHGRFTVLMLLNRCPAEPSTPAELADAAGVTRATMTGLMDTLEKDNLLAREADSSDRRAVRVRMTPKGQDFIDDLLPDYFRCVSAIMQPLADGERKQLVVLLQKVQGGLPPSRTAEPPVSATPVQ